MQLLETDSGDLKAKFANVRDAQSVICKWEIWDSRDMFLQHCKFSVFEHGS